MTHELTIGEMTESLTGFDEIAIEKHYGKDFATLSEQQPTMLGRALVFVAERRAGKTDKDAYTAAMNLPLGQVQGYFADAAEVDPVGEGDAPDAE